MSDLALHTSGVAILLGCALAAAPASAAAQTAPEERGFRTIDPPVITGNHSVSLGEGTIRLDIPDGMTAATPAEVARAYPNTPGPVYLFTAPSDRAHISLVPFAMPPTPPMPLNKLKAVLESQMGVAVGFRWITREVIEVEGRG